MKREQKFPLFNLSALENIKDKIISLLEVKFKEAEFSSCFFVDMKYSKRKIQVFIDADEGINYVICRKISRYLEEYLDESEVMGKEYTLDVSSPGLDQPIKLLRQLPKHIGRKIKIKLNDSEIPEFTGTLIGLEDDVLEVQFKEKKKEPETKKVKFENINESKIMVSFNK